MSNARCRPRGRITIVFGSSSQPQSDALKGRRFKSLAEENLFLSYWESSVADKRIHGTTRKQVAACFEEERRHLQPLRSHFFPAIRKPGAMSTATVTWKWAKLFTKYPPN